MSEKQQKGALGKDVSSSSLECVTIFTRAVEEEEEGEEEEGRPEAFFSQQRKVPRGGTDWVGLV